MCLPLAQHLHRRDRHRSGPPKIALFAQHYPDRCSDQLQGSLLSVRTRSSWNWMVMPGDAGTFVQRGNRLVQELEEVKNLLKTSFLGGRNVTTY